MQQHWKDYKKYKFLHVGIQEWKISHFFFFLNTWDDYFQKKSKIQTKPIFCWVKTEHTNFLFGFIVSFWWCRWWKNSKIQTKSETWNIYSFVWPYYCILLMVLIRGEKESKNTNLKHIFICLALLYHLDDIGYYNSGDFNPLVLSL